MKNLLTFLVIFFLSNSLYAFTQQVPDILIFEGEKYRIEPLINKLPLSSCPEQYNLSRAMYKDNEPIPISSACWRGHYCTYEIIDDFLYLKSVKICHDDRRVDLKAAFGEKLTSKGVKVYWYTGELESPKSSWSYHHINAFRFKSGEFCEKVFYDNSKTKYSRFSGKLEDFIYDNCNWKQLPPIGEDENIQIKLLIETDDEMNIVNIEIKEPDSELSVWEQEAQRIYKMIPEWSTIYRKGERVIQEHTAVFRNEKYYKERREKRLAQKRRIEEAKKKKSSGSQK